MLLLILGIVLFICLVLVHEWGHYIVARRNGVEVEEFGLFFPPRAKVLTKRNGTEYTLNWLPLGGFVKLKGEHDADTKPGTFGAATSWVKTKIMLAGVFMNFVVAFLLLMLLALIGMPKLIDNQYTVKSDTHVSRQHVLARAVEDGSPAGKAGIAAGDAFTAIGKPGSKLDTIKTSDDLPKLTKKYAGQTVTVTVLHKGNEAQKTLTLRTAKVVDASKKTDHPKGYLGVAPGEYTLQRSTWSAPIVAGGLMVQFTELTFKGLGTAIASLSHGDTHTASEQVSGPIGIFVVLQQGTLLGIQYILLIIAIISLSLAIMNLLPIPALDGGRLYILLASRAAQKPLTKEREEAINGAGFMFLIFLILVISVVDVRRFF